MIIKFILVLVIFLYLKWIFLVLFLPFYAFWGYFQNHKCLLTKFLAVPYFLMDKFLRGGGERFVIYHISIIPSLHLRKWIYKRLGANIGKKVVFHFKTEIRSPWKLKVGKGSIIGDNALLDARRGLIIGENVNLSSNVSIYTLQHDYRDPLFTCPDMKLRRMNVIIGNRVWIGSNVIILPGVTVGEGAVCCAGCVVTKDVEPYAVVAGIPAKKVNLRPKILLYEFNGKSCRFY